MHEGGIHFVKCPFEGSGLYWDISWYIQVNHKIYGLYLERKYNIIKVLAYELSDLVPVLANGNTVGIQIRYLILYTWCIADYKYNTHANEYAKLL